MIYKCKIIKKNPINMVIDCNGTFVQMPVCDSVGDIVYISNDGGHYSIASKNEYDANSKKKAKQSKPVKTTMSVSSEDFEVVVAENIIE